MDNLKGPLARALNRCTAMALSALLSSCGPVVDSCQHDCSWGLREVAVSERGGIFAGRSLHIGGEPVRPGLAPDLGTQFLRGSCCRLAHPQLVGGAAVYSGRFAIFLTLPAEFFLSG